MIVAGIGCKAGIAPEEVLAAIDAVLAHHHEQRRNLSSLATSVSKRNEAALVIAAGMLGIPLHFVGDAALAQVVNSLQTRSAASAQATGSPSLSEASALAAAGEGSRLLGPRTVLGNVTCALATTEPLP